MLSFVYKRKRLFFTLRVKYFLILSYLRSILVKSNKLLIKHILNFIIIFVLHTRTCIHNISICINRKTL